MPFEPIAHTADIAFKIWGESLEELFSEGGKALTGAMVEIAGGCSPSQTKKIHLEAPSLEELFVKWLEEILFLFETEGFVGLEFDIQRCEPKKLEAVLKGMEWDETAQPLKTQIKAVTYHGLEIKRTSEGYETEVILDV